MGSGRTACAGPTFSLGVASATNRVGAEGTNYDANGNRLSGAGITNSYDVDNRLIATSRLGHSAAYHYSARNERIVVYENGARQFHFYGVDGLLLGVYTPASEAGPAPVRVWPRERVYFHGRLIQIGIDWVATDRLGSVVRKGSTNYKYAPYGQELGGATENNTAKFATYTRDTASGYDYALNRYYNSQWGRFTSPDPYMPGAPQRPTSWNYYAYTEGDPINFSDPEGLDRIEACDPRFSRTGHVDADCALILHGGGGGGAFEGFRSTYDSVRWEARMVGHRFTSLLASFSTSTGSTGSQPSVTSKITYPEHDPPMNSNAASVLSRMGQSTGALTTPGFWVAWTAAAAGGGYLSQTVQFYLYPNVGGFGVGWSSVLGSSFVRFDYHRLQAGDTGRMLPHLHIRLFGIRRNHWRPWDGGNP